MDRIVADPEFRERAKTVTGGYPLRRGDQVEGGVRKAMRPTLEVKKWIADLLRDKYNVRF